MSEVANWYRSNLPAGATPAPADEVEEGEEVSIYISEGELRVTETVKVASRWTTK